MNEDAAGTRPLTIAVAALLALGGCRGATAGPSLPPRAQTRPRALAAGQRSPIAHVVIVIQENRTVDNLFNGFPGANTVTTGVNSFGESVPLQPRALNWKVDVGHDYATFQTEYDGGKMDGWNLAHTTNANCNRIGSCPYAYVPHDEIKPYFAIASQYVLADNTFQTNQSDSFPAHQELISGDASVDSGPQDRQVSSNPLKTGVHGSGGGCDSPKWMVVNTIALEPMGSPQGDPVFPCFDRPTLAALLDQAGLSWRYYQKNSGAGLWNAFDAIEAVRYGRDYGNVITPNQTILSDIANGNLANVSWVTPDGDHSDHSGNKNDLGGPSWVAAIVNAVGQSPYWNSTAIVVVWDDWGGWYDHVTPPVRDNYELGFRVPMLVVSPYAKKSYVSHVQHEFGSILHFTEKTFGLGSLGSTDKISDDLSDCFDFKAKPRPFKVIPAPPFVPGIGPSARLEDP